MRILNKRESLFLLGGDAAAFFLSLSITLFLRYGRLDLDLIGRHIIPFCLIAGVWFLVFLIAGLYERQTLILKTRLPAILLKAQIVNGATAVAFFYFLPYFGITPKTILFIQIAVSSMLILFWRTKGASLFKKGEREKAMLIGRGEESRELIREINGNEGYAVRLISSLDIDEIEAIDFESEVVRRIYEEGVGVIIVDLQNEKVSPIIPHLYNLIFSKVKFIDMHKVYEDIFGKVPLSLLTHSWFLENISLAPKATYDFVKRLVDIGLSAILGLISLPFLAISAAALRMESPGRIFFAQRRVGRGGRIIGLWKMRTMTSIDGKGKTTKVGAFLRKTRIDELPQVWNIFKGEISFIGPRPEMPEFVKIYEKEIPFYQVRHLISPGASGWAQLMQEKPPKWAVDHLSTGEKLSYDLFYFKNRSILLDLKIALRTIGVVVSRKGV